MADLQQSYRNIAETPALNAGNSPDHSEHLYLIDQFDLIDQFEEGQFTLWGDVFIDARDPQLLATNH
ncbi:MAG: hypothetical protein AAB211_06495 [Pseudomonadota bacterium]